MYTLTGEFNGAQMGYSLASLDFNGDGHKDLAVLERGWNPLGHVNNPDTLYWGKILFYYGGTGFDTTPDFVIQGTYSYNMFISTFLNAGDVNDDGYEDLAVIQFAEVDSTHPDDRDFFMKIYFGGLTPSDEPGYFYTYLCNTVTNVLINPLGDVNNDGFDDMSVYKVNYNADCSTIDILWGGSMYLQNFYTSYIEMFQSKSLKGIGDVNNDGFDDMLLSTTVNNNNNMSRIILYYGGSNIAELDSLVLVDNQPITGRLNFPLGDVNNDGFNDFIGWVHDSSGKAYFGGNSITPQLDVVLSPYYFGEFFTSAGVVHGDLNNDGFEDVIGTHSGVDFGNGEACLWMGRANFNGTTDLIIPPPPSSLYRRFGESIAAGDFNNDGLCDVAISAPEWWDHTIDIPGKIFIYSGNTDLHDTTVANEDNVISAPEPDQWKIAIHPNPVHSKSTDLNIRFIGSGYKVSTNFRLEIFNIKGQKLMSKAIPQDNLKAGNLEITLKNYKPGIYIFNLYNNNIRLTTHKFSIKQ